MRHRRRAGIRRSTSANRRSAADGVAQRSSCARGSTYMADNDNDSDEARVLRPLQAAACTYRIAFGPRAGQKVLTLQGAMPRDTDFKQTLCADISGFSLHAAVRCGSRRPPGAGATVPLHHPPGAGQRARADQRRRAGGAQAQDPLARRHHAPGDVAAGVHAAAGRAGAQAEAAPDSLPRRAGPNAKLRALVVPQEPKSRPAQASKARRVRGELRAPPSRCG
jgi:hypothetical protein